MHFPYFCNPECYGKTRITGETLMDLLNGVQLAPFERLVIIDCRTTKEYQTGHVIEALKGPASRGNFEAFWRRTWKPGVVYILLCEHSISRSPASLTRWRHLHIAAGNDEGDLNGFILDGGYRQFWLNHEEKCIGGS
jgi:rhodanese-related sulfurtransferase